MKKKYKYFAYAETASNLCSHHQFKIGAVIIYKNQVIGTGNNTYSKTHPIQAKYAKLAGNPEAIFLHAEMMSIIQAKSIIGSDLSECSLYIFRRRRDKKLGLARPCKICMKAIKDAGIKNIYYTTPVGYCYEEIL